MYATIINILFFILYNKKRAIYESAYTKYRYVRAYVRELCRRENGK